MPAGAVRLIGISEVGHIEDPTGTPVDTPWGNTQQQGVTLQLSTETVDLMSAQAKMKEDTNLVSASIQLQVALVTTSLQRLQRLWGLPDTAFEGDLEGATPAEEVLSIGEGNLGTEERSLYVLGPGPASTRRVEAARCRVADLGGIQFASNQYQLPQATWEVLNPDEADTREPLVITDAV